MSDKLKKLFEGQTTYEIPVYQRGYAWEDDHVKKFLEDLKIAHEQNNDYTHFFGFMITTKNPKKPQLKFIDGQQRMTTSMLFLVCVRNYFYKHNVNKSPTIDEYIERLEKLIFSFLNTHDVKSSTPRLILSRPNREFFHKIVMNSNISNTLFKTYEAQSETNALLAHAYKQFEFWLHKKPHESSRDLKNIYRFVDTLLNKFTIYNQRYDDRKEAQRLFDLVNHRGRKLEVSDLVKNYLFAELDNLDDNIDIVEYDKIWTQIITNVTCKQTSVNLDSFLHYYLIISSGYSSIGIKPDKKRMYETIENLVERQTRKPQAIIQDLNAWSVILRKVRDPKRCDDFNDYSSVIYYLEQFKALNLKYVYPVVLAAYKKYWNRDSSVFETILMISMKYHIRAKILMNINTDRYERIINEVFVDNINIGKPLKSILDLLLHSRYYPSDIKLQDALRDMTIDSSKVIKIILEEIESPNTKPKLPHPKDIEHIMPKKLNNDWASYIMRHNSIDPTDPQRANDEVDNIHKRYLNYIGNQTLLEPSANKPNSNKLFEEKKNLYSVSNYRITQNLKKFSVWNTTRIIENQKDLGDQLINAIDLKQHFDAM